MQTFLDRTLPILGQEGIQALSTQLIAFAGLGGVGGGAFLNLVRCGVKRFRLAVNSVFDPPDTNRQAAAFASTMDRSKITVYKRLAREINPEVALELFPEVKPPRHLISLVPSINVNVGTVGFQFRNEQFFARSRKIPPWRDTETYDSTSRSLTPRLWKRAIYGWKLANLGITNQVTDRV